MSLTNDIRNLQVRTVAALKEAHDYHTYSLRLWRNFQQRVRGGHTFTFRNPLTGSSLNQAKLVDQSEEYIENDLTPATFQQFVSIFESFLFDFLRLWLAQYPGSVSKKQVEVAALLKTPDTRSVVLTVIDKELNELKYERIADWFAYVERLTRVGCPTPEEIERLAEIKATRDILVHNSGVANAIYLAKSGRAARHLDGEFLEIPAPYHKASWQLVLKVIDDIATAALGKLAPAVS